jgi:predicted phage terminase large subunit-like protein
MSPLGLAQTLNHGWIDNWHQHRINDALERVFIGQCKRLIINVPPRSGKTELAVKMFIAWATGHHPDCEWIHASYSKRLAARNTYETRGYMTHELYAEVFPALRLRDDGKAKDEFYTSTGGVVYATGAGGTITGYGAGKKRTGFGGAVIIDDPLKADDAHSITMRTNVNDWYMSTMQSRLNSPDTPVIVIMQRLHEDDLTGFLMRGGSGEAWDHLVIPALDDSGASYWEAQLPTERLIQMRTANSMIFAGQYMQTPAPMEGGIYKTRWFERRHEYAAPFHGFDRVILSVDGAYTAKEQNDASAITAWGIKGNDAYLLDCHNVRLEYPELLALIIRLYGQHGAQMLLVENKASGLALIPDLQRAGLSVVGYDPTRDKITRAVASSSVCEAGRVLLPKRADWLATAENQLFLFPNAKHDDIVDSISGFLNWWQVGGSGNEVSAMQEFYGF